MNHAALLGNGGHSASVRDVMLALGWTICSVFEIDFLAEQLNLVEGGCGEHEDRHQSSSWVSAFGDNKLREQAVDFILNEYNSPKFPAIISQLASISPTATIGDGSVVMPFAHLGPGAILGKFVLANTGSLIEHHAQAGDYSHIAPGAVLLGGAKAGISSLIGSNAVVDAKSEFPPQSTLGATGFFREKKTTEPGVYVGSPAGLLRAKHKEGQN